MRDWFPNFFKRFIHSLLDLTFPRQCFGCQREKTWLCPACLDHLPRSYSPIEDGIFSVFEYGTPVMKQVIWRLKYKHSTDLAEILAKPMCDVLLEELSDDFEKSFFVQRNGISQNHPIILIPVPLSRARHRFRGYNQAEELAKQIAQINPALFELRTDLIKKVKDTPSQVSIRNREARLRNLKGAFELMSPERCSRSNLKAPRDWISNSGNSSGTIFVIIDDVSTTGTTIGEIRQLLAHAGVNPRLIYGLVVAHG